VGALVRWQGGRPAVRVETIKDASSVRVDVAQRVHDSVTLAARLAYVRHARLQCVVHVHLARLHRTHSTRYRVAQNRKHSEQ